MIDEEAAADDGAGVNFNSRQEARHLREPAGEQKEVVIPEPVIDAMEPDGVQARVTEIDLEARAGRGIAVEHGGNVLANVCQQMHESVRKLDGRNLQRLVPQSFEKDTTQVALPNEGRITTINLPFPSAALRVRMT